MAAATPGGDSVGGGGDSVGGHSQAGSGADTSPRVDGADGAAVGASRGYSPVEGGPHPLEVRAAVAFAKAVMSSPAKSSYQLCSALGPVDLDDDIWEVRFHFPGLDNLERTLSRSDITVLNLLALIEGHGYGIRDGMYYVKEKGCGYKGMELIDSMGKVEEMLALYELKKILTITVLKKNASWPVGFNLEDGGPAEITEPVVISVDKEGVNHISSDEEGLYPVAVDLSEVVHLGTQQSCNFQKMMRGQDISASDDISSDDDFYYDRGEYNPEEHNRMVEEEWEVVKKLQRQKREREPDQETTAILAKLRLQKKQREDSLLHYEGDTDVEEIFEPEEESSESGREVDDTDYFSVKKGPNNPGPTSRSHYEPVAPYLPEFVPSADEESSPDELGSSDDDGMIQKFQLASGKKRKKLKKFQKRNWYDPNRADAQMQFAIKLCFKDVYEFRVALRNFHITQLRNYAYHRNTPTRIIANCTEEGKAQGCPFFITASTIANEKTFCIRKFNNRHTCTPHGENTRVTIDWLAAKSVDSGLLNAISKVFPDSPQRFCLRHIYANFQRAGFRGPELKKYMDAASYAYTKNEFDIAMEGLKHDCLEAYNWLVQIPAETWARHLFDTNCKTDLVVNNISEVFNRMILDVRNKPIWTMLEGIRTKLMVKYSGTREKLEESRWEITPFYTEKLEESKKWSRVCSAVNSEIGLWQVTSVSGRIVAVDLRVKTCGCRKWDLTGIPCNHAVAAIMKLKQHPEDYVHDFFKKPMYREAFKYTIYPVPGPADWIRTNTQDIEPPIFHPKPGRKQVNRRKGQFEVPAPRDSSRMTSVTCSNCNVVGHKWPSCKVTLKPELQIRKNAHQASRHNLGEGSSTSGASSTAPPTAPPTQGSTSAPPTPLADRAVPPAISTSPAARSTSPAARATPSPPTTTPPASGPRPFSAPRNSSASEPGTSFLGKRKPKVTSRMLGYLNAGKHNSYK
ncbi:unnamed protein product [Alopecurus aequalis]